MTVSQVRRQSFFLSPTRKRGTLQPSLARRAKKTGDELVKRSSNPARYCRGPTSSRKILPHPQRARRLFYEGGASDGLGNSIWIFCPTPPRRGIVRFGSGFGAS